MVVGMIVIMVLLSARFAWFVIVAAVIDGRLCGHFCRYDRQTVVFHQPSTFISLDNARTADAVVSIMSLKATVVIRAMQAGACYRRAIETQQV